MRELARKKATARIANATHQAVPQAVPPAPNDARLRAAAAGVGALFAEGTLPHHRARLPREGVARNAPFILQGAPDERI